MSKMKIKKNVATALKLAWPTSLTMHATAAPAAVNPLYDNEER